MLKKKMHTKDHLEEHAREETCTGVTWDHDKLMDMVRGFQPACVIAAAAELGLFDVLAERLCDAANAAAALQCDLRGMTVLLDALAALGLLRKQNGVYSCADGVADVLTADAPDSQLAMARHLANCLRRWSRLARVVRTGRPADIAPSVRGATGDAESFIEAMNDINRHSAQYLVKGLDLPPFTHLLDIGGGPATWTIAFLREYPNAHATLFDLPDVIPIAEKHVEAATLQDRVHFVAGDMYRDELPRGADLAWVSAIVHMNSREQNRDLFRKTYDALPAGGHVLIRDLVMTPERTKPTTGALFAVNMLVATDGGGTFTFDEFRDDLEAAGFRNARLIHEEPTMSSVVKAEKP